jgi:hypothetical protein
MKNKTQLPKVLTLLSVFLLFILSTHAQPPGNRETDSGDPAKYDFAAPSNPNGAPCSITGLIKNYRPIYRSAFTLILWRDGKPTGVQIKVTGPRYTIPNVPEGNYELRSKGFYRPNSHAIFAEDSREVTCKDGHANRVNFRIDSGD